MTQPLVERLSHAFRDAKLPAACVDHPPSPLKSLNRSLSEQGSGGVSSNNSDAEGDNDGNEFSDTSSCCSQESSGCESLNSQDARRVNEQSPRRHTAKKSASKKHRTARFQGDPQQQSRHYAGTDQ